MEGRILEYKTVNLFAGGGESTPRVGEGWERVCRSDFRVGVSRACSAALEEGQA